MTANFSLKLSKDNIKSLNALVSVVSRIGKEFIFEVDGESSSVALTALNDGKSAFLSVEFDKEYFYDVVVMPGTHACKVPSKAVVNIFSNLRNVESLVIKNVSEGVDHELVFEFLTTIGIIRTYRFCYQDCDIVKAVFDENDASFLQSQPKIFMRLLDHLHKSPEVVISATSSQFRLSSFHATSLDGKQYLNTGLSVEVDELDLYEYKGENEVVNLVLCTRELRALLTFCEVLDLPIFTLYFTTTCRPLQIKCSHLHFVVSLVLATMEPAASVGNNGTTSSTSLTTGLPEAVVPADRNAVGLADAENAARSTFALPTANQHHSSIDREREEEEEESEDIFAFRRKMRGVESPLKPAEDPATNLESTSRISNLKKRLLDALSDTDDEL